MTPASPPKRPTGNIRTVYMSRLRELMNDYDALERNEEKLLGILKTVRREEGYLMKALNDEVFTGQAAVTTAPKIPTTRTTPLKRIDEGSPKTQSQYSEELQTKKPPPPVAGLSQIQPAPKDTTAATTMDTAAEMRPRRKRRPVRPVAETWNKNTVRHLEANRRAQRREERVLARQRLENALFAEDDDESTSSSSS